MFKKFITLMMVVTIFAVNAHAVSNSGLKAAFDELNYALTVEWDQTDKEFHAEQMKKFTATLRDLQAKGLTNEQLIAFVKSEVKNEKVIKDLETAFNMISINKMTSSEANKYIIEAMKNSYANGASFNGEAVLYLAVGFLIIAAAVGIAVSPSSSSYSCRYRCFEECYYDYWGYLLYCDQECGKMDEFGNYCY